MAGSYSIDVDRIKARLGEERVMQLTDDDNAGAIDITAVDEAIVSAEAEMHLYAGVYYDVPLRKSDGTTVPDGIKDLLTDSTCWRLMTRRPEFLRNGADEGEFWERRRKEILAWLNAIAHASPDRRLLVPGAVERSTAVVSRGGGPKITTDVPRLSTDSLKGFLT